MVSSSVNNSWMLMLVCSVCGVLAVGAAASSAVSGDEQQQQPVKRELSPSASLDQHLPPYWMALNDPLYKRAFDSKRHISPAFGIEEDVGNMRNLFDVGKRQVSMANDVGRQMQMYTQLFDAGKKRSNIAPSMDVMSHIGYADLLERAGRK
ncbi:hypothetical protein WR25_22605 [Diploscapter pachys]|uniref:Uncharacterized protein n=1 Tax=Diploscapter pachys TaxID=2018661 RepID=A0A2A2JPI8_9BILA|nr:hypothetical protein WR25_22605 [Diploscapter pachys]